MFVNHSPLCRGETKEIRSSAILRKLMFETAAQLEKESGPVPLSMASSELMSTTIRFVCTNKKEGHTIRRRLPLLILKYHVIESPVTQRNLMLGGWTQSPKKWRGGGGFILQKNNKKTNFQKREKRKWEMKNLPSESRLHLVRLVRVLLPIGCLGFRGLISSTCIFFSLSRFFGSSNLSRFFFFFTPLSDVFCFVFFLSGGNGPPVVKNLVCSNLILSRHFPHPISVEFFF